MSCKIDYCDNCSEKKQGYTDCILVDKKENNEYCSFLCKDCIKKLKRKGYIIVK